VREYPQSEGDPYYPIPTSERPSAVPQVQRVGGGGEKYPFHRPTGGVSLLQHGPGGGQRSGSLHQVHGGASLISVTNAAVVVAFNRKELLAECLDGLMRQSLPLDAIYVIDNASTDGTNSYLQEKGYLDEPRIRYIRLPVNGGGAGGFYHGVRAAFESGYDWIWLMDDDTEPEPDALRLMEPLKAYSEVVAIANHKLDIHGRETLDGLRMLPKQNDRSSPYPRVKFSSFVGILIRGAAVEKIGFPRSEFFIHNDDLEYCLRLRKIGEIALARGSRVMHKEQARQIVAKSYFGFHYLPKDLHGYFFEYYGHRNYVIVQRTHAKGFGRYLLPIRRFLLALGAILFIDKSDRRQRIKVLLRANIDGWRDNFDNDYPFRMRKEWKTPSGPK
jgi:rhamnopyranosyl-N-acetylglucosaminyl-diphospho-decaprenol beta-1,3/1,4-galactofuranosyltransferase